MLTREERKTLGKNVSFAHFRILDKYDYIIGHCTAAVSGLDDKVYYAVVFCSPTDQFSRKEGRKQALRHMFPNMGYAIVARPSQAGSGRELVSHPGPDLSFDKERKRYKRPFEYARDACLSEIYMSPPHWLKKELRIGEVSIESVAKKPSTKEREKQEKFDRLYDEVYSSDEAYNEGAR